MPEWTPDQVKALRERLGLDRAAFAALLGYGAPTRVSELEKTDRGPINGTTARLLDYVEAFGVLPVAVDQGDQRDRYVQQAGGQRRDAVEPGLRGRVQQP